MTDYKKTLSGLTDRIKSMEHQAPIQKVKPVKTNAVKTIRSTVYLPEDLHEHAKLFCVKNRLSMKEFVTQLIEEKFNKSSQK